MARHHTGHPQRWRTFCAVDLSEEARSLAAEHAARLRREFGQVRAGWEGAGEFYLKLKLLGELEPRRVEDLQRAATRAAAGGGPFELTLDGPGTFPPRGAARVLWLGVRDEAGALAALQRRLEDECAREGFPRETKNYHPHLTLARLRDPRDADALTEAHLSSPVAPETFDVTELLVVRSELGPGGSRYTTLSRHPLKNEG